MDFLIIARKLVRTWTLAFGYELEPKISTTTGANTPEAGACFYCVKPMVTDAIIGTAKDINGNAISAFAGMTIFTADELKFRFSEITFTTTDPVILYQKIITDSPNT